VDLIAVGLVFNAWAGSGSDLSTLRYFGVLQRIGLCSLLAVVVLIATRRKPWIVMLVVAILLVAYGQWLSHSGYGCGHTVVPRCNAAGRLDASLVSNLHLYRSANFPGYDPEGLASTVGSLATVLLGWLTMNTIIRRPPSWRAVMAAGLMALGLWIGSLLSPITAGIDPIKRIWTPAFALRSCAPVVALLGVARLLDLARDRWIPWVLAPMRALGRQALVVYVGQHLLGSSLNATHVGSISAAQWVADHWVPGSGERRWMYYAVVMTLAWVVVAVACESLRPAQRTNA
jgi:predicted acyltransferase